MIETIWRITKNLRQKAVDMAKNMGILTDSITEGAGNTAGFIGKIIVHDILKKEYPDIKYIENSNLMAKMKTIGIRVKRRTVDPKIYYNCSVTLVSLKDKFDYFAFGQVDTALEQFWLLGFISWDRFMRDSFILNKGDKDGKFIVRESCRNIKIGNLDSNLII